LFVGVDVMDVYNFVEVADCAGFCGFSVGFEIDVVGFSLVVGFVFVEVEDVVVAAWAEAFGVDLHFSFTTFAGLDLGFPVKFFVAGVAEAFGVVFFFGRAVATFFYHHVLKKDVRI